MCAKFNLQIDLLGFCYFNHVFFTDLVSPVHSQQHSRLKQSEAFKGNIANIKQIKQIKRKILIFARLILAYLLNLFIY